MENHHVTFESRAKELGIPVEDERYAWIVEQSIEAPLPDNWIEIGKSDGIKYYRNLEMDETVDEHPGLSYYKHLFLTMSNADDGKLKHDLSGVNDAKVEMEKTKLLSSESILKLDVQPDYEERYLSKDPLVILTRVLQSYLTQNISTLVGCLMDYSEECQLELRNYSSWEGIGKVLTERLAELTSLGEDGRHPLEDGRLQSLQVCLDFLSKLVASFGQYLSQSNLCQLLVQLIEFVFEEYPMEAQAVIVQTLNRLLLANHSGKQPDTNRSSSTQYDGYANTDRRDSANSIGNHSDKNNKNGPFQPASPPGKPTPADKNTNTAVLLEKIRVLEEQVAVNQNNSNKKLEQAEQEYERMCAKSNQITVSHLQKIADLEDELRATARSTEELASKYNIALTTVARLEHTLEAAAESNQESMQKLSAQYKNQQLNPFGANNNDDEVDSNGLSKQWKAEMTNLHIRIANLSEELKLSNDRMAAAESKALDLLAAERNSREQILSLASEIEQLQRKLTKKSEHILELKSRNNDLDKTASDMMVELQNAISLGKSLDEECDALRKKKRVPTQFRQMEKALEHLCDEIESKKEQIEDLEMTLGLRTAEKAEAMKAYDQITNYVSLLEAQIKELRYDITDHKKLENQQEGQLCTYSQELELLTSKHAQLSRRYTELLDRHVDLEGNIRVFLRVRPVSEAEQTELRSRQVNISDQFQYVNNDTIKLTGNDEEFQFDKVFTATNLQADAFAQIEPMIQSALHGCHCGVAVYGQSGSGKTYSLHENDAEPGLIVRSFSSIFNLLSLDSNSWKNEVKISIVSVYNEICLDVLEQLEFGPLGYFVDPNRQVEEDKYEFAPKTNPPFSSSYRKDMHHQLGKLSIISDKKSNRPVSDVRGNSIGGLEMRHSVQTGVIVDGLSEHTLRNAEDANAILSLVSQLRDEEARKHGLSVEQYRSKSHWVVLVQVNRKNAMSGESYAGRLCFVHLADSDRSETALSTGSALREAQTITRSLSVFGDVVNALASGNKRIPYRNSKLTYLLQDYLSYGCKLAFFVHICPPILSYQGSSLLSLEFGAKCRSIKLGKPKVFN